MRIFLLLWLQKTTKPVSHWSNPFHLLPNSHKCRCFDIYMFAISQFLWVVGWLVCLFVCFGTTVIKLLLWMGQQTIEIVLKFYYQSSGFDHYDAWRFFGCHKMLFNLANFFKHRSLSAGNSHISGIVHNFICCICYMLSVMCLLLPGCQFFFVFPSNMFFPSVYIILFHFGLFIHEN